MKGSKGACFAGIVGTAELLPLLGILYGIGQTAQ